MGAPDSSSVLVPTSGILAAGRVEAVECPLENPGAISLDAIDRALETVNADLCWELIVRFVNLLPSGPLFDRCAGRGELGSLQMPSFLLLIFSACVRNLFGADACFSYP